MQNRSSSQIESGSELMKGTLNSLFTGITPYVASDSELYDPELFQNIYLREYSRMRDLNRTEK